jgi:cell division protein FtsW
MNPVNDDGLDSGASQRAGQGLLIATLGLLGLGVVMVHSAAASVAQGGEWYARVDVRHTFFAIAAAAVLMTVWRLDFHWFFCSGKRPVKAAVLLALALGLGLLVFVPGVGHSVGGFYRWIRLGPAKYQVSFQPSELIKLALVIFLAAWLTRPQVNTRSFLKTFMPAMLLIAACMALIISQDFGTSMLIAAAAGMTLFLAGVPWPYLGGLVATAGLGFYCFVFLNPYRWSRIEAMFDPWSQNNQAAYQARMSLTAIGRGGWYGQGLGKGIVKQGFLPEDTTDFLVSAFCEEWGFRGHLLLMGMVVVWTILAWRLALKAPTAFGKVVSGSLAFMIVLQMLLHIGVNLVVLPTKGIGFPFMSAGGTSLIIMAAATAIIVSVSRSPSDGHRSLIEMN